MRFRRSRTRLLSGDVPGALLLGELSEDVANGRGLSLVQLAAELGVAVHDHDFDLHLWRRLGRGGGVS